MAKNNKLIFLGDKAVIEGVICLLFSYNYVKEYKISVVKANRAINSDGANRGGVDKLLKSAA